MLTVPCDVVIIVVHLISQRKKAHHGTTHWPNFMQTEQGSGRSGLLAPNAQVFLPQQSCAVRSVCVCVCVCARARAHTCSVTVVSDSLRPRGPHGISQARILEWVAISSSRGSFLTQGLNPHPLHGQVDSLPLYLCATWEIFWM